MSTQKIEKGEVSNSKKISVIGLYVGLVVYIVMGFIVPSPAAMGEVAWKVLAVCIPMIIWWVTTAMPLGFAAMAPMFLSPWIGLASEKVGENGVNIMYGWTQNTTIVMFAIGCLSAAIVTTGLHKRVALTILNAFKGKTTVVLLGFMIACGVISMFISNTTSCAILVPIAVAICTSLGLKKGDPVASAIMVSLPFMASIGGMATPIGSGTNVSAMGLMENFTGHYVSFAEWLSAALPFVVLATFFTWFILVKFFKVDKAPATDPSIVENALKDLGKMSSGEKKSAIIFVLMLICVIFRKQIITPFFGKATDPIIMCTFGMSTLFIPKDWQKREFMADSNTVKHINIDTLLLLVGGQTMGHMFQVSGITQLIADRMGFMANWNSFAIIALICVLCSVLTEFMTNQIIALAFLPVVNALAASLGTNPWIMYFGVTLSVSLAFMFPSATPPNAFAFSSGMLEFKDMAVVGFIVKIALIILFIIVFNTLSRLFCPLF